MWPLFIRGGLSPRDRSRNCVGGVPLSFWGIFFCWEVFPVLGGGFGGNLEFGGLLGFPRSLRAFSLFGLASGFAAFPALPSVCWRLARPAGATAAKPGVLPAML